MEDADLSLLGGHFRPSFVDLEVEVHKVRRIVPVFEIGKDDRPGGVGVYKRPIFVITVGFRVVLLG